MKPFLCCLLIIQFASMVVTAPVRARRENVLTFINGVLEKTRTTEKTIPANTTEYRNPPSYLRGEEDSEDMSETTSTESFDTNVFKDAVKDLDSYGIMIPTNVHKDKSSSKRKGAAEKESVGLMDSSKRLVQDHGSREHSGPHRPLQASREWSDFHSEEETTVAAHGVENSPGKQVFHLGGVRVTGSAGQGANLQRKAGRVDELNGMLAQDESREVLDRDSLEDNNGRLVPVGNRDRDYDETREDISSERYPLAAQQLVSSS